MTERGFKIRDLGEIAIRCTDIKVMRHFYEHVLGVEVLDQGDHGTICFFRVAEGVAGHTTVLALFQSPASTRDGVPVTAGPASSLHHLAFSLPRAEQDAVTEWYDANGIAWRYEEFRWIGWRGIFATDPEGSTVEPVAYDPALLD